MKNSAKFIVRKNWKISSREEKYRYIFQQDTLYSKETKTRTKNEEESIIKIFNRLRKCILKCISCEGKSDQSVS